MTVHAAGFRNFFFKRLWVMNRFVYILPLTTLPLLVLAERSANDPLIAGNPYVTAVLVTFVSLVLALGVVGYFRLRVRGRVVTGIFFCAADWVITASIMFTSGANPYLCWIVPSVTSCLTAFMIIRYPFQPAFIFKRRGAPDWGGE
jgi:hypothetical protein